MANKPNPMLAKIEEKYRRDYQEKLAAAYRSFEIQFEYLKQMCKDAALMAADDVFDVNEYSAEKFRQAHEYFLDKMATMVVDEDKDDPEMVWSKATIDKKLLQIQGPENFRCWDVRFAIEEKEEG